MSDYDVWLIIMFAMLFFTTYNLGRLHESMNGRKEFKKNNPQVCGNKNY